MNPQIEDARRQLTRAVGGFLRAVAASPDTHQASRDHARQHGPFPQPVTGIGGDCRATFLADGTIEWIITSHTLGGAGTITINERTRTWVVKDDDNGTLRPVADSNQQGSDLPGNLLMGVAGEVESMLHAYEQVWLNPAPAQTTRTAPPVTRQQITQQAGKPGTVLGFAGATLVSGWCCGFLGWLVLFAAVYLIIREYRKLQGAPMPMWLIASIGMTAVGLLSHAFATWFWVSQIVTVLNQPY